MQDSVVCHQRTCMHFPLNSMQLTTGQLHSSGMELGIPVSGMFNDLRLMIEGRVAMILVIYKLYYPEKQWTLASVYWITSASFSLQKVRLSITALMKCHTNHLVHLSEQDVMSFRLFIGKEMHYKKYRP